MKQLIDLISGGEDKVIGSVVRYAVDRGYSKYTSTLEQAWRVSVRTLSSILIRAAEIYGRVPELTPDENYLEDPISAFGVVEAQRHRERGITLGMFLGLLKYYRQSYVDLVEEAGFGDRERALYRLFVDRCFDRVELAVSVDWGTAVREDSVLEELRGANRFLANEKNKYLTLFESSAIPTFLLDNRNRIDNANRAASALLGRSRIPGSEYYCMLRDRSLEFNELDETEANESRCLTTESASKVLPWLDEEMKAFLLSDAEDRVIEKAISDGDKTRHLQVCLSRMQDVSRKFSGSILSVRDVTDRRRAEEALRQSEERYRTLVETMNEGLAVLDPHGTIEYVNRSFSRMLGSCDTELIGMCQCDLVEEDQREVHKKRMAVLRSGTSTTYETVLKVMNGKAVPVILAATPLLDGDGNFAGSFAVFTDITERRIEEKRQKELVEELKHFAYFVSHDLRAPLTNIRGYCSEIGRAAEIVRPAVERGLDGIPEKDRKETKEALNLEIPEAMAFIESSVSHMDSLIEAILGLSRIGYREFRPEPLDMNRLAVRILGMFSHELTRGNVEVSVGQLPDVTADRIGMEQVLANLVGNAIKFREPSRHPIIVVDGTRSEEGRAVFRVADNGIGIPEEHLESIFDMFRRVGKKIIPGEGMGLAYVRTLVRRMGGSISVESRPGVGSTFTFDVHDNTDLSDGMSCR